MKNILTFLGVGAGLVVTGILGVAVLGASSPGISGWTGVYNTTSTDLILRDGQSSAAQIDRHGRLLISPSSSIVMSTVGTSANPVPNGYFTNLSATETSTLSRAIFGPLNFATDSGMQSWVDLSVTTASLNNATTSYSAQIDGVKFLTIAALSDGSGGIKNRNLKFGRANSSTVIYVGTADGCSAYVYAVSTTNPTPTATSTSNCN